MKRKLRSGLICGGIVLVLVVVIGLCWFIFGRNDEKSPTKKTANTTVVLPESEYNIHCVLTESAIRYADDGKSYEIDTFSLDQNKVMTLVIDESGIIPLEGRVYRVYVSKKDSRSAVFAAPVNSGGIAKTDLSRRIISSRSSQWLYTADKSSKYHVAENSIFYYMKVMDGYLRRVEADTVESFAQYNKSCPDQKNHAHTSKCFRYNAYVKFNGGFLTDYEVVWAALSIDGSSIYYYLGTEEDTQYAMLPGQESTTAKLVVTTSDVTTKGTIGVKDFTGKAYTCNVNKDGVQPVGGRFYRIDKQEDGSVRFSVPSKTRVGNEYDFFAMPVTGLDSDNVTFSVTTTKKLTEKTQMLRASVSWTGWMTLESVDASKITLAQNTNTCKNKEVHEHTKSCYYYNSYYKTDGYNGVDWIVTEKTGKSIYPNVGCENDTAWGTCDPANTAVILLVDGKNVKLMDMNGNEHTCTYTASKNLPVYEGGLYHIEWENRETVKISKANTTTTTPGFDCVRHPLCSIDGNTLVFGTGENEKVTKLTADTKIFYMAAGDNRLIPMSSGELQTAHHTNSCLTKGEHEHTNSCYYYNSIFGCDGQGNLKWVICSVKNSSISATLGSKDNKVNAYASPMKTCFTLTGVNEKGRVEIQRMNGTRTSYPVHPSGLAPVKGRIYACEWKDGKMLFSNPNQDDKNFSRSGIVEIEDGYITISDHQTFRLTENTRIYSVEKVNDKLVLLDEPKLGLALPTTYCKGLGEGHEHVWNKCYSGNFVYATDGAGTLLWMIVRPDGNAISSYIGGTNTVPVQAGSAEQVLFTTSSIILKDGTMRIKGIDMTGAVVEGELSADSFFPVKGSIYHMEKENGRICLSVPNADYRKAGYDFGRCPLYKYADDTLELLNGEKYNVTSATKIFNVETVGGILVLKEGKDLPIAKCKCTESHTHVNDCYTYNMFFAVDANDDLMWIMAAPSDMSIFYKSGLDATDLVDSGDPAAVAVTQSHTYPVWVDGVKEYRVQIIDMTGTSVAVKVDENGVIPAEGKGYHIVRNDDGTVRFSQPTTYDAPSDSNVGYDFARYQALMADNSHVVLRNGKLLTVTADTKVFSATINNNKIKITPSSTIVTSKATASCEGEEHNHVSGCFPYTIWYACDKEGNLKWIISQEDGSKSIYSAQGSEKDVDLEAPNFENTPVVFVTKTPYTKDGQKVVDLKDIFGKTYTAQPLTNQSASDLNVGLPYKVTFSNELVTLEPLTANWISREKGISYADGTLTGDSSRSFKIAANTYICYVKKNADNTLTLLEAGDSKIPVNGFPKAAGYNILQSYNMGKTSSGGYIQWMMIEVNGESIYNIFDWYVTEPKDTREASQILLMTSDIRWDRNEQKYLIDAVDMSGNERVLVYTRNESGVIPVKGKVFLVTTENGVMKFAWPNVVNAKDTKEDVFYDVLRACVTAYDAKTKTITVNGGKQYVLAEDIKILGADRFEGNETYLAKYVGPRDTILTTTSNYNAMFGLNEAGEIVWILNNTNGKSIYNIADNTNYKTPSLPDKAYTFLNFSNIFHLRRRDTV